VFWRKRRVAAAPGISAPRPVDALVAELAMMDADFERRANATSAERAEYDARRSQLKARLSAALAAERGGA
jgi:hypothetical protein